MVLITYKTRMHVCILQSIGAVTQTVVKGISQVNEAGFKVGLVYRGTNMWFHSE